jgi:hypothetical protein
LDALISYWPVMLMAVAVVVILRGITKSARDLEAREASRRRELRVEVEAQPHREKKPSK